MSPKNYLMLATVLLAGSIAFEITRLAGLIDVGDYRYHQIHVLLIGSMAGSQFALYFYGKRQGLKHGLALLFAIGACLTGIGDYVNGAISQVEPVSLKLTWALLWFGAGYMMYSIALWQWNHAILKRSTSTFATFRHLVAIPFLVINVVSWFLHVQANVTSHDLLCYGSFIFNASIYVMLPTFAVWYFYNSGRSVGGLIVLVGGILVPYSDLILFGSWLRGGDPAVPSIQLYAYNWILYFGGQILLSVFPALVMQDEEQAGAVHICP